MDFFPRRLSFLFLYKNINFFYKQNRTYIENVYEDA